MRTNIEDMARDEHERLETIVRVTMKNVRKTTARTWRVHGEDIVANALARVWYEFARSGEAINLKNPSRKHLVIVARCCQRAVHNPFSFISASSLYSNRETAAALGVSISTAHAYRRKIGHQKVDQVVRLAIRAS